jgi:predicted murein hydrolase (TIGR00659 family)
MSAPATPLTTAPLGSTFNLWAYLQAGPLLWLFVTVLVWLSWQYLAARARNNPLLNPVFWSIVCIGAVLMLTGTPYPVYFEGARFLHFILGPATVALSIALYDHFSLLRRNLLPICVAVLAGCGSAITVSVLLGEWLGLPTGAILALAAKSTTAPVAMAVSERLGAALELTACMVVLTGVFGSVIVTPLMNALKIRDYAARGFAAGLTSHGIGTARAFSVDPVAGAFAAIAMVLSAVATALLVPALLPLLR